MKISDLKIEQREHIIKDLKYSYVDIKLGTIVKSLNSDMLGMITGVLLPPHRRYQSIKITWKNGKESEFFENDCECEIIKEPT